MATCTPSELIESAKCFQCLSSKELKAVIAQLLCNIASGGTPTDCNDRILITADTMGGFAVANCSTLLSIDFPNVSSFDLNTDFVVTTNNSLVSVSLPLLQSTTGTVDIDSCPNLISIDLTSLQSCVSLVIDFLNVLPSLSLPSLTTCDNIIFDNNLLVTSVDLPLMGILATDLNCSLCPFLSSWNAPLITFTAGTTAVLFPGCALNQSSVEQILARCVASGVFGATIDLSGGTNFGIAGLSPAAAADLAALIAAPNTVLMNP